MNWRRELPTLIILLAFSLYGCLLLFFRYVYSDRIQHTFFVWNVFLAWIPYGLSLLTMYLVECKQNIALIFSSIGWFLFYPNAPYLLTDLLHMKLNPYAPIWYELFQMVTFAIIGLFIGYVSLEHIRQLIQRHFGKLYSWIFASLMLFLTSFGIYLGRFLRWNSWNVITHPLDLLEDIGRRFLIPFEYPTTWVFTLVTFGLLMLFHVSIASFAFRERDQKNS